ncbi:tetratricopeptide repeat protein [bacterium]|nr:tetratricopeptide repeat protein [bacterium]
MGQRLRAAGKADEALPLLDRAEGAAPDSPHVALHKALTLADAGRTDEALERLATGADRWEGNPVFPLFRGMLLFEAGRLDDARAPLAGAKRLSPHNRLVGACEALVDMRDGHILPALRRLYADGLTDNSRALAHILTAVEGELFRRFGPDTDGPPAHAPELDDAPDPRGSAQRLLARGMARLEAGDPVEAYRLLRAATTQNPSLPGIFAHLGFACYDLGNYEQALDLLDREGDWSECIDAVHLHRGAAQYKLSRFDDALASLTAAREADELANYRTFIELFLGRTLVALGRPAEAAGHFRAFIDLEGDMALARLRQARELLGLALPETAPRGYDVVEEGPTTLIVKTGLLDAVRDRRPPDDGRPAPAGRAPMERIALPHDGVALVRHGRRGGLLGKMLGGAYFDGTRSLRELAVSDALRRRGVPTPEVVAAIRHTVCPGVYRMETLVREVPHARDLAAALPDSPDALDAAARLLRQCHDAGLAHPDLNARNILIDADGQAMIIDLDRAALADALSLQDRAAMLARLYRSLHKLGLPVDDARWKRFYDAYAQDDADLGAAWDTVLRRCRRELRRHQVWWRVSGNKNQTPSPES